jgi:hypothetical protein
VPLHNQVFAQTSFARAPTDPFPSAAAFRDALVGGREAPDRSDGAEERAGRRITPRRTVLAISVITALAVVGTAITLR